MQRNWLYLDNIFGSSNGIKEKCGKEFQEFSVIDRSWQKTMKAVFQKRRVKDHCTEKNFQMFTKHNNSMDEIQKKIEEYLDEKRTESPRLYFMSNDELLQLLSKSTIEGVEP